MTAVALGAVLVSAALHAVWNGLLKSTDDPAATAALFVGGAAAVSGGIALLTGQQLPEASWPAVVASGLVEAVYFVTLANALAALPLGTAYGLARGGGQLVTWPISVLRFGEAIDVQAIVGALLVSGGLASTARDGGRGVGLLWAFACALTIGVYPLTYKAALVAGADEAALFAASLGLALPVQVVFLGRGRRGARLRAAWSARPVTNLVGSLLCAGSFLAFLVALEHAGAGRASALRNLSVLFAAGIGAWRGEPVTGRTIAAYVAIVVGAALVL